MRESKPGEEKKGDTLDDLCPVCGEPIKNGDPWTLNKNSQMIHEACEGEDE